MDTEYVKALVNPLLREAKMRTEKRREFAFGKALIEHARAELVALGFTPLIAERATHGMCWWSGDITVHLWEADHIVPVVHGGGGCGLENLRTLCRPCHLAETRELAGRRAKDKRIQTREARHQARMLAKAQGLEKKRERSRFRR